MHTLENKSVTFLILWVATEIPKTDIFKKFLLFYQSLSKNTGYIVYKLNKYIRFLSHNLFKSVKTISPFWEASTRAKQKNDFYRKFSSNIQTMKFCKFFEINFNEFEDYMLPQWKKLSGEFHSLKQMSWFQLFLSRLFISFNIHKCPKHPKQKCLE